MGRRAAVAVVLLGLCQTGAVEQPVSRVAAGRAAISGRVIDALTERPLAGAILTLAHEGNTQTLNALSGDDGAYLFEGVAAGGYRVTAQHPGYVTETYGTTDTHLGHEGILRVADNQHRRNVNFALRLGGSISGRVTDQNGNAVKAATVAAMPSLPDGGYRFGDGSMFARVNERGEYLMSGLPEGLYRITVTHLADREPGDTALAPLQPTFYPGTTITNQAVAVRVTPGETTTHIDIPIVPEIAARISGVIVRGTSTGQIRATLLSNGSSVRTVTVARDDTFSVARLKPGTYTLIASAEHPYGFEAGYMSFEVAADTEGLFISLAPTGTIAGRIVTDDGTPLPHDLVQISAVLAEHGKAIDPLDRDRADVSADGTFEVRGVFGERTVRTIGGTGWRIARVLAGKAPLETLHVPPGGEVRDLLVVLTRQ